MRHGVLSLRVVVAGQTPAGTAALAERLNEHRDIEVVGLAGSTRETIDLVETLTPHAVLVSLARAMGPEAVAAIQELGARVIVLSDAPDSENADGAVAQNADLADAFYVAASLAGDLGPPQ